MAKDITIKNPQGTITYYPKTVSQLVYDNETDETVKEQIDAVNKKVRFVNLSDLDTLKTVDSLGKYVVYYNNNTNAKIGSLEVYSEPTATYIIQVLNSNLKSIVNGSYEFDTPNAKNYTLSRHYTFSTNTWSEWKNDTEARAEDVSYDDEKTDLGEDNVQDAIDTLVENITTKTYNFKVGAYFDSSGSLIRDPNYGYIEEYFPVTPNENVVWNTGLIDSLNKGMMIAYTSSKQKLDYYSCIGESRTIKMKSTAYYIRISFPISNYNAASVYTNGGDLICKPQITNVQYPNEVIGDLEELKTTNKTTVVDAINEVRNKFIVGDSSITTGYKWVSQQTTPTEDANYCLSDFIPCVSGDTIEFSAGVTDSNIAVPFFDANKNYLGYYSCNANPRTVTLTAEVLTNVAYCRLTFIKNATSAYLKVNDTTQFEYTKSDYPLEVDLGELNTDVEELNDAIKTISPNNFSLGGYWNGSNELVENANYAYTDYIEWTTGNSFRWRTGGISSAKLLLFTANKTLITTYAANAVERTDIRRQSETYYIKLGFLLSGIDTVSVYDTTAGVYKFKAEYDNVSAIGDLTQLQTSAKTNLVDAINEAYTSSGGSTVCSEIHKDKNLKRNQLNHRSDFRFIHFSDIHGDVKELERIIELSNTWGSTYLDAVINSGDIAEQYLTTTPITWYNDRIGGLQLPLITAIGNHDTKQNCTASYVYTNVLKPSITLLSQKKTVVQPTDAETNGYNYYYVDFNSVVPNRTYVIRVIVLDGLTTDGFWNNTERTWLNNVLSDAHTNNYYVLICLHTSQQSFTQINCNFSVTPYSKATDTWNSSPDIFDDVQTFIDGGGKFLCYTIGHSHMDGFLYPISNGITLNKQPMFMIQCAHHADGNFATGVRATDNSEYSPYFDSFNYMCVDIAKGIIKVMRIGVDFDVRGVSKQVMVYDFINSTVLYQS